MDEDGTYFRTITTNNEKLPVLYEKYLKEENVLIKDINIYDYFNDENLVPKEYLALLKEKLEVFKDVK